MKKMKKIKPYLCRAFVYYTIMLTALTMILQNEAIGANWLIFISIAGAIIMCLIHLIMGAMHKRMGGHVFYVPWIVLIAIFLLGYGITWAVAGEGSGWAGVFAMLTLLGVLMLCFLGYISYTAEYVYRKKVLHQDVEEAEKCPKCGRRRRRSEMFCPKCGHSYQGDNDSE